MEKRKSVASIQHHEEIAPETIKNIHAENMSLAQIQKLVHLIDRSDIAEIELNRANEGLHLTLRKLKALEYVEPINEARHMDGNEPDTSPDMPNSSDNAPHLHCLQAHIVGIFHPWLKRQGKILVAVGDLVKSGQIVGTIEALTILNEVETTVAGRVTEIFVQDSQAVEFGQPLLTIDTSEGEPL